MVVVNFAHPLTDEHLTQIEALSGQRVERVIEVKTMLNDESLFAEQVGRLLDGVPLDAKEWQALSVLINLPSHAAIAAAVLTNLHGRMGHFPVVVRTRPAPDAPGTYVVCELLNLQAIREQARQRR